MVSSVNSVIRELGGALGIAVVGSVVSAAYRHNLATPVPGASRDLTTAHAIATHLPAVPRADLLAAADHAFTSAMDTGMRISAAIALAGAVAALAGLSGHRRPAPATGAVTAPALGEPVERAAVGV